LLFAPSLEDSMFRKIAVALLGIAAIVFGPDAALAQRKGLVDVSPPHYRHGFWIEGGLGWGEEQYKFGNDPYNEGLGKPTFGLRLGGTVNSHVRLGAEWNIWVNGYQDVGGDGYPVDVNETLNAVMAIARIYPSTKLGLFLKGGAGSASPTRVSTTATRRPSQDSRPRSARDGKCSSAASSSSLRRSTGISTVSRSAMTIRYMSDC
jgi:hypothetical protein